MAPDAPNPGDRHRRELEESTGAAHGYIDFASITVAELVDQIDPKRVDAAWLTYMTDRYVTPAGR
jgi:hypothetical protein